MSDSLSFCCHEQELVVKRQHRHGKTQMTCKYNDVLLVTYMYELPFSKGQRHPKGKHLKKKKKEADAGQDEEGKKSWLSLISVAAGVRLMVFKNRSGIRPFTFNVRGDYTLIEVI